MTVVLVQAHVKRFDNRWGWTTLVWMNQTGKGEQLAVELYRAGDHQHTEKHGG